MHAPRTVRWAVKHGVARAALQRAARHGDVAARLAIDAELAGDPFRAYEELRGRGRVVRERLLYATVDHAATVEILRSDAFRVGVDRDAVPRVVRLALGIARDSAAIGPVDPPSMLVTDPPDHTRYRKLVTQVFSAREIAGLQDRIEELAEELLDSLAGADPVDLVAQYARQLPVTIIAEILGVPPAMRPQALAWGDAAATLLDIGMPWRQFRQADQAVVELNAWGRSHFERLRTHPDETLLSRLVAAESDGQRLSGDELMAIALLLFGAGFETTVNLISNGAVLLLQHPEQLAALRADPQLWPGAVEEVLRYESPVQNTVRLAARDTTVCGVALPAGAVVVTLLGGANRDPAVFPDPQRFDVRRSNAREHVAFSSGIHFCLGAALARAEGEVALRALFARFPGLSLAGAPQRRPSRTLRGWERLPVSLHGGRPALVATSP